MDIIFLLGRILFGGFFIWNGINHFRKTGSLAAWVKSKRFPMPKLLVLVTGVMLVIGGLSILFWMGVTFGIILLVTFLIGVSFTMHNFWTIKDNPNARAADMVAFAKNIAIIGALLLLTPLA